MAARRLEVLQGQCWAACAVRPSHVCRCMGVGPVRLKLRMWYAGRLLGASPIKQLYSSRWLLKTRA